MLVAPFESSQRIASATSGGATAMMSATVPTSRAYANEWWRCCGDTAMAQLRLCRLGVILVGMSATKAEVFDLEEHDRVVVASLDSEQSSVSVRVGDESVVLPEDASRAVRSLLRDLATGVPVHVIPADAELTTQQAADLLGLSRTYVVRLIDQGSLSAHMAGTHRRLLASDVLAYRERRASQLAALGELTEADEELGLSY